MRGVCSACGMRSATSRVRASADAESSAPAACMPLAKLNSCCARTAPAGVRAAMELQAEAERRKRAQVRP